jgi:hypothetical protein
LGAVNTGRQTWQNQSGKCGESGAVSLPNPAQWRGFGHRCGVIQVAARTADKWFNVITNER